MNMAALPKTLYAEDATKQVLTSNLGGNYGDARCFFMSIKDLECHIFVLDAGHKGAIGASAKCDAAVTLKPTTQDKANILQTIRDCIKFVARAGTTELTNAHNSRTLHLQKSSAGVTADINTPLSDVVIDFSASA